MASGLYLIGMLTSAAFGVYPNVLPSNMTPNLSLTIYDAAIAKHGLIVGLFWFIPGMALGRKRRASGYEVGVRSMRRVRETMQF